MSEMARVTDRSAHSPIKNRGADGAAPAWKGLGIGLQAAVTEELWMLLRLLWRAFGPVPAFALAALVFAGPSPGKPGSHRPRGEQLASRLGFQLADGGREVTGQDGRVRPARFGERGRRAYLGFVFKASAMGLLPGSTAPQSGAKIS
jgi:hypothetical protein